MLTYEWQDVLLVVRYIESHIVNVHCIADTLLILLVCLLSIKYYSRVMESKTLLECVTTSMWPRYTWCALFSLVLACGFISVSWERWIGKKEWVIHFESWVGFLKHFLILTLFIALLRCKSPPGKASYKNHHVLFRIKREVVWSSLRLIFVQNWYRSLVM
jgi:hypothetical protein